MKFTEFCVKVKDYFAQVNAFKPKKATEAFTIFVTNEPMSIEQLYAKFLSDLYHEILGYASNHLEMIVEIPFWMNETLRANLIEDLHSYGYKLLYEDKNIFLISWRV